MSYQPAHRATGGLRAERTGQTAEAAILGALLAPLLPGTPSGDLAAARARWAANPLRHYRLEFPSTTCPLAVEVRDEQVVAVLDNPCGRQSLTVSSSGARPTCAPSRPH